MQGHSSREGPTGASDAAISFRVTCSAAASSSSCSSALRVVGSQVPYLSSYPSKVAQQNAAVSKSVPSINRGRIAMLLLDQTRAVQMRTELPGGRRNTGLA
jgi:hypothetical protein